MKLCSVQGCKIKHFALGYCRKHHIRFKRNGTTDSLYDKSSYSKLGGIKDIGHGRRGSLAVNIINDIKHKAVKRGKEWHLTHEQAFVLIKDACNYCGDPSNWPVSRNGIDRVDNNKGYNESNCVSCCAFCNSAKKERSLEEFIAWIKRLHSRLAI